MDRHYYELLREFVITDFKLRYKHSVLGLLWVILKPLALFFILYLVWSAFLDSRHDYRVYLLSGVIIMSFIDDAVIFGMQSLLVKAHILLKVNFPREVLLFSSITVATVNFLVNIVVFIIIVIATGSYQNLSFSWNSLPLALIALAALLVLVMAISFFTSILYVTFRDLDHLVTLILRLLFWGTPIVYDISALQSRPLVHTIVELSPVTILVQTFRNSILAGPAITASSFTAPLLILGSGLLLLLVGYWFYRKNLFKIAERF